VSSVQREVVGSIRQAQGTEQWCAFVSTVMDIRILYLAGDALASWAPVALPRICPSRLLVFVMCSARTPAWASAYPDEAFSWFLGRAKQVPGYTWIRLRQFPS
jgi:hypothetical protein